MCDSKFSQKGNLNEHKSAYHEEIQTLVKKGTWMDAYE